jgi:hypothetical protein
VVVTKPVTNLGSNPLRVTNIASLAQDDGFFSFAAQDDVAGRYTIWRLNVTADEALAPGYVPPTAYDDPRLQQVLEQNELSAIHTWNPEGTRFAYSSTMTLADGTQKAFIRVKNLIDQSDVILSDKPGPGLSGFKWSPTDDRIVSATEAGDVWACYADTPGLRTWVAQSRTYKSGSQTITEQARYPHFRPDRATSFL